MHALVMGVYGSTMFHVQVWEFNLASLVNTASFKTTTAASLAATARRDRQSWSRIVHLTQRATASEMRRLLENAPANVEPAVLKEITDLISIRDRLAHRYLREELISPQDEFGLKPTLAHARELQRFSEAFRMSCVNIETETRRIIAALGISPPEDLMPFVNSTLAPLLFSQARPPNGPWLA